MKQAIKALFESMVGNLPKARIPYERVAGWVLQGSEMQVVFFEIQPPVTIPIHSHGNQFGIVLEGEAVYTIGGEQCRFVEGDVYFIPSGVKHSAVISSFTRLIDFFGDANRYQLEEGG
ncbi:MAG: cupin domain-containing protein [Candidatus Thorarchaeota archaeon]